jgi:hypothetical protein
MTLVHEILELAKSLWKSHWDRVPDEKRLRLAGIEQEMATIVTALVQGLWSLEGEYLDGLAEEQCRNCGCGRRCDRQNHTVTVKVLGIAVPLPVPYFYCRTCKKGQNPVRRWLGVQQGDVSMDLQRKVSDLTTRMTFGDAVDSLAEQHGQQIERTQAERITYRVGHEAAQYLQQRRSAALSSLEAEETTTGPEDLQFTADGGFILARTLQRPPRQDAKKPSDPSALTPVRKLAKGSWETHGREVRYVSVHEPNDSVNRKVDLHIAPHNQTDYTGERMLATASEAGLSDNTAIHGVFDMGKWIHTQFNEQFHAYRRTLTADISHVTEYLTDAARVIVGSDQAESWAMARKHRLLDGAIDAVLADLAEHRCGAKGSAPCVKNDQSKCLVRVAERYIRNHRIYMNYPEIRTRGLAVGSGEAECGVKQMKKRLDVPGGWKESNAQLMLALLCIRRSGWWDDFWSWRDRRDVAQWSRRQRGKDLPRFRGRSRWQPQPPDQSHVASAN